MAFNDGLPRILSRPLRVHWAGWKTDTYTLQQAGWQISAEQDVFGNSMRLAMKHDGQMMQAISETIRFDYHLAQERWHEYLQTIAFHMRHIGHQIMVHEQGRVDWSFNAIDATPSYVEKRISRMEDLCHFAAPLVKTREIIIPQDSVPELLERIMKLQQPDRTDRIREEMRSHPAGAKVFPQQRMEAQIISLAA